MSKRSRGKDKYVECPYYNWGNKSRICCEGVEDGCTTNLIFGDENKAKEYIDNFCCTVYGMQHCLIYRMLNGKYGVK